MLSYHDFANAPSYTNLLPIWQRMRRQDGVDVVKIAVMPHTLFDTHPLLDLLRNEGGKGTVLLGMGEAGIWTRVLAGKFGSPLTYARGENSTGTAPGQLTWRQLQDVYRFHDIRPDWPIYGVIGNPIAHSLSPCMQNAALRETNTLGVYLPFKVECPPALFVRAFTALGLRGLSVTIPHKENVREACDALDPASQAIGAVNTLFGMASGGRAAIPMRRPPRTACRPACRISLARTSSSSVRAARRARWFTASRNAARTPSW